MYGVSRSASNRGAPNPFGCANTVPAHAERSMSDARGPTLGKSGPSVLSRLRPKRPQELFLDFCLEGPHAKRDRQSKESRFALGTSGILKTTPALTRMANRCGQYQPPPRRAPEPLAFVHKPPQSETGAEIEPRLAVGTKH